MEEKSRWRDGCAVRQQLAGRDDEKKKTKNALNLSPELDFWMMCGDYPNNKRTRAEPNCFFFSRPGWLPRVPYPSQPSSFVAMWCSLLQVTASERAGSSTMDNDDTSGVGGGGGGGSPRGSKRPAEDETPGKGSDEAGGGGGGGGGKGSAATAAEKEERGGDKKRPPQGGEDDDGGGSGAREKEEEGDLAARRGDLEFCKRTEVRGRRGGKGVGCVALGFGSIHPRGGNGRSAPGRAPVWGM